MVFFFFLKNEMMCDHWNNCNNCLSKSKIENPMWSILVSKVNWIVFRSLTIEGGNATKIGSNSLCEINLECNGTKLEQNYWNLHRSNTWNDGWILIKKYVLIVSYNMIYLCFVRRHKKTYVEGDSQEKLSEIQPIFSSNKDTEIPFKFHGFPFAEDTSILLGVLDNPHDTLCQLQCSHNYISLPIYLSHA